MARTKVMGLAQVQARENYMIHEFMLCHAERLQ